MIWLLPPLPFPLYRQQARPATHRKTEKERQLAGKKGVKTIIFRRPCAGEAVHCMVLINDYAFLKQEIPRINVLGTDHILINVTRSPDHPPPAMSVDEALFYGHRELIFFILATWRF